MGCLQSKKDSSDIHPNVFRVVNIDEHGGDLCSGQLEITESDIILYREGRDSTVWPLHSLRRYGFEGDLFSFESGRRCETGEGIYAFRCRRASILFRTLQQQIQLRNVIHDTMPYPVSRMSPLPQARQTLQASVIHRSSVDNGQPELPHSQMVNDNFPNNVPHNGVRVSTQSPRSPSSADILEVMPLYPRSQTNGNHVTNVYQMRDFKREHNNNTQQQALNIQHVYSNDLNRDLAILRNNLRQEAALNTMRDIEDETLFLERRYINENIPNKIVNNPISPTLSNSSEHYAQLNIDQEDAAKQESARLYMNILPTENTLTDTNKNDTAPSTPLTPKPVEYCNLSIGTKVEMNAYANLSLGDLGEGIKNAKQSSQSEHNQKFSESDTFTSMSPVEELEVNYAILDIDSNKEQVKATRELASPESQSYNSSRNESTPSCSSQPRSRLVSQGSMEKSTSTNTTTTAPSATIGYTTIDFDKTVALTSVAAGAEMDGDGQRKTRHDSCTVFCGSPSSVDKSKGSNN
ncbi:fibroblast growth factor receptor substrate 2 [Plodia interpunctella]|uniref:fibroblast growth factor receptor substrate 2 n=1 Tax=Plodia interpunctella TaxID=58824 RepID=UPI002368143C|nr:fibroblast growth factor receptor substrate 2 [Plodia interpunctella]XP_053612367.1 fibroblast growth factor receptor substrate 2 [Plodia interpunctella]